MDNSNFWLLTWLGQLIVINTDSVNIINLDGNISMSSLQHWYQIISITPALLWSRHAITARRNSNWYLGYYTYVEYSPRWVVLILVLVPRTVEFLTVFGCHSLHLTNFGQKLSVWTSDPIKDGIWILAERVPLRWLRNKEMCVGVIFRCSK